MALLSKEYTVDSLSLNDATILVCARLALMSLPFNENMGDLVNAYRITTVKYKEASQIKDEIEKKQRNNIPTELVPYYTFVNTRQGISVSRALTGKVNRLIEVWAELSDHNSAEFTL